MDKEIIVVDNALKLEVDKMGLVSLCDNNGSVFYGRKALDVLIKHIGSRSKKEEV